MNEQRLREALREQTPVDGQARERTLSTLHAAFTEQEPARRPRRRGAVAGAVVAMLVMIGVGAAALTEPGAAVARWAKQLLGVRADPPATALTRIPGGGRLLVTTRAGAWVVGDTGTKRLLGAYAGAGWSPRGLFVIGWRDRVLTAVEPSGRIRWTLTSHARIASAAWAPGDGFRIAYIAGGRVRIVNGDGSGDRAYARARGDVAPAWRPGRAHVVAYADRAARIRVAAVDDGAQLWRSRPFAGVRKLDWSPDGRLLLAVGRDRLLLLSRSGRRLATRRLPAGHEAVDAQWSGDGRRVALSRHDPAAGRGEVVLLRPDLGRGAASLVSGPGRFPGLAWSPNGRRLLVPWPQADQLLFLRASGRGPAEPIAQVARQFRPDGRPADFPRTVAWCCRP